MFPEKKFDTTRVNLCYDNQVSLYWKGRTNWGIWLALLPLEDFQNMEVTPKLVGDITDLNRVCPPGGHKGDYYTDTY